MVVRHHFLVKNINSEMVTRTVGTCGHMGSVGAGVLHMTLKDMFFKNIPNWRLLVFYLNILLPPTWRYQSCFFLNRSKMYRDMARQREGYENILSTFWQNFDNSMAKNSNFDKSKKSNYIKSWFSKKRINLVFYSSLNF